MTKYLLLIFFILSFQTNFSQIAPEWINLNSPVDSSHYDNIETVIDATDNLYLTAANSFFPYNSYKSEIITIKVNSSGSTEWIRKSTQNIPDSSYIPVGIKIDNQGNVIVLGYNNNAYSDFILIKYSSSGIHQWSYRLRLNNLSTRPDDFVIDNQSNIYICGAYGTVQDDRFFISKLNNNGTVQWVKEHTGPFSYYRAKAITVDISGNVYATGYYSKYEKDILVVKYDASGNLMWSDTVYSTNGSYNDAGYDIILDNVNNLYVTGGLGTNNGGDTSNATIIKYNTNGTRLWQRTYVTTNVGNDWGKSISIDNLNNIYVGVNGNFDICFLKYDPNGNFQWIYKHPGYPYVFSDPKIPITFDELNNIYISGIEAGYNRKELILLKLSGAGTLIWNKPIKLNALSTDYPVSFIYKQPNRYFLTGNSDKKIFSMKLLPAISNTVQFSRNSVNKPILNMQSVYDTIMFFNESLPADSYIADVTIQIDSVLHSATGDLEVLLSHNGLTDTLIYRRGGPFDNFFNTRLNDTSAISICSGGTNPYNGSFRPCKPLKQFNSLPVSGPWVLQIHDYRTPDEGLLKAWSLTVKYETTIGLSTISSEIPISFHLHQNYPNPFNPVTKIRFSLPKTSPAKIIVYDVLGKEIRTVIDNLLAPGTYETDFDASGISSGIYFYRLITEDYSETKKMVLIK